MTSSNVKLTKGAYIVTISTTGDEEIYNNEITSFTPPQTSANWSSGPKTTKIIDLQRIKRLINIDGELGTGIGSGVDSQDSAEGKKSDLINIYKSGGVVTMNYEGSDLTGVIQKLNIKRKISDARTPIDGEAEFDVKFDFLVGVDI